MKLEDMKAAIDARRAEFADENARLNKRMQYLRAALHHHMAVHVMPLFHTLKDAKLAKAFKAAAQSFYNSREAMSRNSLESALERRNIAKVSIKNVPFQATGDDSFYTEMWFPKEWMDKKELQDLVKLAQEYEHTQRRLGLLDQHLGMLDRHVTTAENSIKHFHQRIQRGPHPQDWHSEDPEDPESGLDSDYYGVQNVVHDPDATGKKQSD